ncbi:glycosyl hydrolase 115 family protein [bacterium]
MWLRIVILLNIFWTHFIPAHAVDNYVIYSPNVEPVIIVDSSEVELIRISANLLAGDIELMTGYRPAVLFELSEKISHAIIIGTVNSSMVQQLLKKNPIPLNQISGKWEMYTHYFTDEPSALNGCLVICGSDPRGAAYGVFDLSEKMGVSPWVWWADVNPDPRDELTVPAINTISKTPSVKYRGIFLNDEDWGLQPWAAKTYEKEPADIGPKTYARIFELLLRLKGNSCWPAMHNCTKAFNYYRENKVVADRYQIIMGASHCEPLLRNNVDEWKHDIMGDWNYVTNRDRMIEYWDQRVRENAKYENLFTVGLRGVHDSGMVGVPTMEDKITLLMQAINDQREILSKHVDPEPANVPQIFCPYKEVLNLYENGLEVPDDVTIVWADDNHGYIRQLSDPQEQTRSGGSGVYYHLSYWGAPADYLWLGSSAPAVTAYELHKAYAYGADRLWMFNVGDIKPIEKEMTFALEMAWNVDRWTPWNAHKFCADWAGRTFGSEFAEEMGEILTIFYRLATDARPEHLLGVAFSETQINERLSSYQKIAERAETLKTSMPERLKDAYFQLVYYPVISAKLMNEKILFMQYSEKLAEKNKLESKAYEQKAQNAFKNILELTRYYNKDLAHGKWKHMMTWNPNNRPVFKKPSKVVTSRIELDARDAKVEYPLHFKDGYFYNSSPTRCNRETGGQAVFHFNVKRSQWNTMWLLVRTPSDKEDSWFVSFNDWDGVVNDQVTGYQWRWIKVGTFYIRRGENRLVFQQREPNAAIKSVMFTNNPPGYNVIDPVLSIPAKSFTTKGEHPDMPLKVIPGYRDGGVTIEDFTATPLPDEQIKQASWVEYEVDLIAGDYRVSALCMPTHCIHKERGARIGIALGEDSPVVQNLHSPEKTGQWSVNVMRGYSIGEMSCQIGHHGDYRIRIYLPEPGVVLSAVNIYKK